MTTHQTKRKTPGQALKTQDRPLERITRRLDAIGSGWVGSPGKIVLPGDDCPMYHIYADAAFPYLQPILRFRTLAKLIVWTQLRQQGMDGLLDGEDYTRAIRELEG